MKSDETCTFDRLLHCSLFGSCAGSEEEARLNDLVLLAGVGAGFTVGAASLLRWEI